MTKENESQSFAKYLTLTGAPFILFVAPIFGYFIGKGIDEYFATHYFAYAFLILGIIAGLREFYKLIKSINSDD